MFLARITVFKAMFANDMLESSKNEVDISDFKAEVVEGMLEYIYTGEVKSLPALASELLQISDKYDQQGLKKECEKTLAKNLTVENATELLSLACQHNAIELKYQLICFMTIGTSIISFLESIIKLSNIPILIHLIHI
jgi:hypothetical protein